MDIKNTISGVDMDFIEQKKVRLCKKNLKIINFSKYHLKKYLHNGKVLQHANALS